MADSVRSNGDGNGSAAPFAGVPSWIKIAFGPGLAVILVFWLLGAFPWMASPVSDVKQAIATMNDSLVRHDATMRSFLGVNALICRGVWKDNEEMQNQCAITAEQALEPGPARAGR